VTRFDASTTIRRAIERVSPEEVKAARGLPSSTLHEAAGRVGAMPFAIKPVHPSFRVCGPAVTVESPAGDNLWLHRAIYLAKPGDVLVVQVGGAYDFGYWGEIMSTAAKLRRLAGLIIDGCVRDLDRLVEIGFPVFARGLCIRGTGKDFGARGWINAPTRFANVTVAPGDLVLGDADGVVSLERGLVPEVLRAARAREAHETKVLARLAAGDTTLSIYGWNEN
jgi:4-hydroxy-4-methyl-2-oxoglutarate aldolase